MEYIFEARKKKLATTKYWMSCIIEYAAIVAVTTLTGFAGKMLVMFVGFTLFQVVYQAWIAQKKEDHLEQTDASLWSKTIVTALAVGGIGGILLSVFQLNILGEAIYTNVNSAIIEAYLFTVWLTLCTWAILLCITVNKLRFLRIKKDDLLKLEQADTVKKDELLPMTGGLTEEVLRHNLRVLGSHNSHRMKYHFTEVEKYAATTDERLSDVMAYYDRLDQLITLGCDAREATILRAKLDETRAEAYKSVKNIIILLVLLKGDSQVKEQIDAELATLAAITSEEGKPSRYLREYTMAQLHKPDPSPTTAEEIMKIISLANSLFDGSRGQEMVQISEIFPEDK